MPPIWDTSRQFQKAFSSKLCLAPAAMHNFCNGNIIKAHTIPKSISLSSIAIDGHVYAAVNRSFGLDISKDKIKPKLIGINLASTFTGFCANHDSSIFSPVERFTFSNTPEQCFLLYYRALAREYFTKTSMLKTVELISNTDKGLPLQLQIDRQSFCSELKAGVDLGISDLEFQKREADRALANREFGAYESYIIQISGPPSVMCCGAVAPDQDYNGRKLQDLSNTALRMNIFSITSFFDGINGYIIFTWRLGDRNSCKPFIDSLHAHDDTGLPVAITNLIFEYFENICIHPPWWDNLSDESKSKLIRRINSLDSPWSPRSDHCLADDRLQIPPWQICRRTLRLAI